MICRRRTQGGRESQQEKLFQLSRTLPRGAVSLVGGEGGDSGGGVMGALVGDVSGEASVEKGDCLRRMERSSEGLAMEGGGLRERPFPRREKGGGLGDGRCSREGGGEEEVISSITSRSREGSRSITGLTGSSSASDWSSCTSSTSLLSVLQVSACCSACWTVRGEAGMRVAVGSGVSGGSSFLSEGCSSSVTATGTIWLGDWLSLSTGITLQDADSASLLISACCGLLRSSSKAQIALRDGEGGGHVRGEEEGSTAVLWGQRTEASREPALEGGEVEGEEGDDEAC